MKKNQIENKYITVLRENSTETYDSESTFRSVYKDFIEMDSCSIFTEFKIGKLNPIVDHLPLIENLIGPIYDRKTKSVVYKDLPLYLKHHKNKNWMEV